MYPKNLKDKESIDQNIKEGVNRRQFVELLGLGVLSVGASKIGYSNKDGFIAKVAAHSIDLAKNTENLPHYYGHNVVIDEYGVIAPWYNRQNGQCDFRVRIAAETLKRYPWTTEKESVAAYPYYIYSSKWAISSNGEISPEDPGDWMNGDLGQRSTSVLKGLVDYYRYSGDPSAIAHMTYMGDYLLNYCLTPANHSWPLFPISVPVKGKPFGRADPNGMIQLDICASMGESLLRAYQVTKYNNWLKAAKHWGDLFAEKCNMSPNAEPWPRYANPECIDPRWKNNPIANKQTGGVTMVLAFLDELIRMGYTGKNGQIIDARDAGLRYLRDQLLPKWTLDKTWGLYFWDWLNQTQNCSTTADVADYIIKNKKLFPNWQNDARNILTLFLNHSSASPDSDSNVYNGAWAYPESSSCCKRSLWYPPLMDGAIMAQYGVVGDNNWMRELAYRQMILQTYDIHESGVTEDDIDGGVIVNGDWFNIAHPWPLLWIQKAIGWLPEELGASRENHIVKSSAVVDSIVYGKKAIVYTIYDAPLETIDVLRLSYIPTKIFADGQELKRLFILDKNGYIIKELPNGDTIVSIRHDGKLKIMISGTDPQRELGDNDLQYQGVWNRKRDDSSSLGFIHTTETKGNSVKIAFNGNQVRLIGKVDEYGGQADVFIDGVHQRVFIDFWSPASRSQQVVYYKNGLIAREHTLKIVARGTGNPYSKGKSVYIDSIQFSSELDTYNFPSGTGPHKPQHMIFGYKERMDYEDKQGNLWRPGTEVISRIGSMKDTVAECWMRRNDNKIINTQDPELYRYGYLASDFWVNVTVGPGMYGLRLKFAATSDMDKSLNGFNILINNKVVVHNLNVVGTAKGLNKAADLTFNSIKPLNGIIQIRFSALSNSGEQGKAFVQALEVIQGNLGEGVIPVSF